MRNHEPLLRRQLLHWLLIPLSLLLVTDAVVSYWIALKFAQRAYDRALVEIGRDVALHLDTQDGSLKLSLPETARRLLFSDPEDRIIFEIVVEGRRIDGAAIGAPSQPARAASVSETLYDSEINGTAVRVAQLLVPAVPERGRPAALVRVAETKNKRNELAREILASVVVPQVMLVLIAGILVWVGVIRGLSPLERIRQTVLSRSLRDGSRLSVSGVPGEVRPLLHSINELLESLDAALTMQSRFIGDAAHQLKTPMAALETQLEVAMREEDPKQMRQSLEKVRAGFTRLSRVITQILALARNEPEAVRRLTMEPVDLNALALEASTYWVPEALKKQIDLGYEGSEAPVLIEGSTARLRELCDNLIDNAIRYSCNGGRVTVRVSAIPQPCVTVSDDSPTIPEQERGRIFERFHRLLGTAAEGSGLGLAIVKEIAQLHGARVYLQNDSDGVGNVFGVVFPVFSGKSHPM